MTQKVLKQYRLGDMTAYYPVDEEMHMGFMLCPSDMELPPLSKAAAIDSLVQVKLVGDIYNGAYAPGNTMREGGSTHRLRYGSQTVTVEQGVTVICTNLLDDRGYRAVHRVEWKEKTPYIRVRTTFYNESQEPATLEMMSSFSLTGISPYAEGDCGEQIRVHRLQSRWSEEGRLETSTLEQLQLETSWTKEAVRCERFGSVGSMPVSHYFPFLAVEDTGNQVYWGAQLAAPSSWQMEIYRVDENIAIDGGIADREFGHWMKNVEPGDCFAAPEAILTVCRTETIDELTCRLTAAGKEPLSEGPECEKELPIIFNEYCSTWGCPSEENISNILEAIQDKGFSYFVIDCGWYKEEGVPWDISMGDYDVSKELFPSGLEKTVECIRKAGLKPGIWFEIENVGSASRAYHQENHLLHRDGTVLTTSRRRFWDMKDEWVQAYLDEKVIGTLKTFGFEYMKVDYNDEIGIGCDGYESLGEGLRQNMEETYRYFEKVREEVPGIILENCASGGHRLEPGFMSRSSMASFSDAHECLEIPIIAANLHRAILPQQSQIWAVIRKEDSLKRIAYSMVNTFLGRMCLSGDVTCLSEEQWGVIEDGMDFYRELVPIIRDGRTYRFGPEVKSIRHPRGWQGIVRLGENGGAYVTIHIFGGEVPEMIKIPLPEGSPETVERVYSDRKEHVVVKNHAMYYVPEENEKAAAVILR